MLLWLWSNLYFYALIFINQRRHIHSRNVRKLLYDVGKSVINRFAYQLEHDIAPVEKAKLAKLFLAENQRNWHESSAMAPFEHILDDLCHCVFYEYPNPKLFKKKRVKHCYRMWPTLHRNILHLQYYTYDADAFQIDKI